MATPTLITALGTVPVCHISAGGATSLAVTVSGRVFGWGRNRWVWLVSGLLITGAVVLALVKLEWRAAEMWASLLL